MNMNKIERTNQTVIPKAKICLTVIAKNEANVIERMLNSVSPIIDYYCIVDTGSTDGTQDIVKKFFEAKGIPGNVIEHPWKNFQDARNKAIEEGHRILKENDAFDDGFCFWIDCDEELQIDPKFNIDKFKTSLCSFDGGNVMIHYGGQKYYRMQFYKASAKWYFYGPVHEVLINDEPVKIATTEGMNVLVRPDGNSWTAETQQQKYEGHAKILEDYVANDPKKDPRWLFYLAQSYRDAGTPENMEKSLKWYEKRRDAIGGYWEEVYFSALMAANLKSQLKHPENEVVEAFMQCGKYNISRIEHLLPLMAHYQSKKEYDIAYIFGSVAIQCDGKTPIPNSSLFIDESAYVWRVFDIHSLNCWYSGRKEEGVKHFRRLLKLMDKGKVPAEHHQRIRDNKKYFIGK